MLNVFTTVLPDVPYIPLLYPNLGVQQRDSILFLNNAFSGMQDSFVRIVDRIEDCDCVLLAHNWPSVRSRTAFVREQERTAIAAGKPLVVFWHGDGDGAVPLRGAIVFRTSLYRYNRRPHETAMPAYAEDLLGADVVQLREKHDGPPVVGFCGWAKYKNFQNAVGTYLRNGLVELAALVESPQVRSRRKGLSFRRESIAVLQSSSQVSCNFLLRSSYSGHRNTIRMDAATARAEYRRTMQECDLALCVKGDGNYSYRFYEALSVGRIPLLIDTQCVLPLADRIPYDEFVLRVDYRSIANLPMIIADWWRTITPEHFLAMQRSARAAYVSSLSVPAFFRHITDALEHQFR